MSVSGRGTSALQKRLDNVKETEKMPVALCARSWLARFQSASEAAMNISSGLGKRMLSSSTRIFGVSSCNTETNASNAKIISPSLNNSAKATVSNSDATRVTHLRRDSVTAHCFQEALGISSRTSKIFAVLARRAVIPRSAMYGMCTVLFSMMRSSMERRTRACSVPREVIQ